MANLRDLKKDLNYVLGDIIDAVYIHQTINPEGDTKKSEAIIDDAISTFDEMIARVNDRKVENRKAHIKAIRTDLEAKAKALVDRINAL